MFQVHMFNNQKVAIIIAWAFASYAMLQKAPSARWIGLLGARHHPSAPQVSGFSLLACCSPAFPVCVFLLDGASLFFLLFSSLFFSPSSPFFLCLSSSSSYCCAKVVTLSITLNLVLLFTFRFFFFLLSQPFFLHKQPRETCQAGPRRTTAQACWQATAQNTALM